MLIRVWRTAKGELIPLNQMATSHLINCINKIKREYPHWRAEWLEPLELELYIRDLKRNSK